MPHAPTRIENRVKAVLLEAAVVGGYSCVDVTDADRSFGAASVALASVMATLDSSHSGATVTTAPTIGASCPDGTATPAMIGFGFTIGVTCVTTGI